MLVDVPGVSELFLGDVVAYSNQAKIERLGVPAGQVADYGAVSPEVAESMARGACDAFGSTLAVSTTGIAGPTGGTPEKPIGLVYVGVCLHGETAVRELNLRGDRWHIMDRAAKYALNFARLALTNGIETLNEPA
jgi:nicotinamide-nucleotide amidase